MNVKREKFGSFVMKRRAALGKTMREIAQACEVTTVYISDIENGKRTPRLGRSEVIKKLEHALQLEPGVLEWEALSEEFDSEQNEVTTTIFKDLKLARAISQASEEKRDRIKKILED